jgi:predicted phage baseplate assembly protein
MSCTGNSGCMCGCCAGISVQTPQGENNPPGQSAIAYRTGSWATFKDSMLARLSSSDYPALAGLKTRSDDDFSIALLDASAVVLDILTFYQERLANESYLRTATRLYSMMQLSQLIGYTPSPGVSASVYLAFNLSAAPGLPPNPTTNAITIPAGTTVQSVAAQGISPQAFQTSVDILGKPDWNALPVQTGNPWGLSDSANNGTSVYLAGTATQLQQGDAILIVGDNGNPESDQTTWPWLVGLVSSVTPDPVNQRTLVTWTVPTGASTVFSGSLPAGTLTFYALRQRAALFGYNAIDPQMLAKHTLWLLEQGSPPLVNPSLTPPEWNFDATSTPLFNGSLVDLDAIYSRVTADIDSTGMAQTWLVLVNQASSPPTFQPYSINSAVTTTRSDYGMSGKITRVTVGPGGSGSVLGVLQTYYDNTRTTSVLVQSDELPAAEQPFDHPVYGTLLNLEIVRDDLVGITAVAISGNNPVLTLNPGVQLTFYPYDNSNGSVQVNPGDQLTLLQPPNSTLTPAIPDWSTLSTTQLQLVVADSSGRPGTVNAYLSWFTLAAPPQNAPVVQEVALVSSIALIEANPATSTQAATAAHTQIVLTKPLLNCYDRTVTTVNANVGAATAGSPVTELLGNGSAATPNQAFTLKQSPLTYVPAANTSGSSSSLTVTANGAAWNEEPSLYNQPPTAQVYETINLPGGGATVQFGDGVEGATLPTGQNNVVANYRVGIGASGNVLPGTISTLVDRPLGVNRVNNPMAATGGQNAQSVDNIRANAPQSVLTLGRAVSITDYQNLAATYAGIAKAYAIWIPNGIDRGVFITVAASNGAALVPPNITLPNLVSALASYGVPNINIKVRTFNETLFGLTAQIAYDPAYDLAAVETAIREELASTYSFASRSFGQGVSADEIAGLIQGITGVVAVNVSGLTLGLSSAAGDLGSLGFSLATWQTWIAQPVTVPRPISKNPNVICPYIPVASIGAWPVAADILVIDPDPTQVTLTVMA